MADRAWFAGHLPEDGGTTLTDLTDDVSTIGIWGPRARDILSSLTDDDVSDAGFGFLTCREIDVRGTTVLASRISYVGELGWELYVPMGSAADLWEALLEAGAPHGAVPAGIGVYGTTGRIEKGYRAYGAELDSERTIVEAGMQRPKVKAADFVGKEAYLAQRAADPATVLCTLTVDDHTSASGMKRYMLGGEPILTRDGGVLTDGHGHHPYVTSAGSRSGTRCTRPARRTAPSRSASASTAPRAGSRRATAPSVPSSTPSAPSSRPACSGRR
jgi:glycine cleavage system aminomethyltransferase T